MTPPPSPEIEVEQGLTLEEKMTFMNNLERLPAQDRDMNTQMELVTPTAPLQQPVPSQEHPPPPEVLTQEQEVSQIVGRAEAKMSNPSTIENSSITTKSHRMISIQKFNMLPKHVRIFNIIKATFRGLCLPSDEELATDYGYRSSNRKVSAEKIQVQSDRLIRKGSAGVWVWNSEMQVGEYYYLTKKSSKCSSQGPISRYSGWATDGSPGHHPPSKEQMPSKLLEKFKDLQGYKWYWFKDRWLLFSLHNA
ncbi:hypothetical protein BY996DRAFT_8544612 [Phakopsora pachyrhizi]|nr:hypothetical protein BY996DRAFT_8544612 [Phakopsora pachyrhizi]